MNKNQNDRSFAVCGIVEINDKIMLVRHTYGSAKGRILLPGGFVKSGELPTVAAEREIFEETGVKTVAVSLISMQFKSEQWCAVFVMDYVEGEPVSDGYENDEVLLLPIDEAIERSDITNMSREILKAYKDGFPVLGKSNYMAKSRTEDDYVIFGV